ncbi:MAG: TauD/TfdA family dioxygenase [Acidobacteriaceae bacterium]|jgi:alpha-ketoglutarate-dependent taurine dioxygenase
MTGRAADLDVTEVKCTPGEIVLTWQNSSFSVYSALWLRDNDPANRDPLTGQRLIRTVDLPREPRLRTADLRPSAHITLSWEDGVISVYPLRWLRAFDRSLRIGSRPTRMPWMGQPATAFAWCDYTEWVENPASRQDWLYYVGRDGLAFLRDVPMQQDAARKVAGLIGFARETHLGRTLDTSRGLHTSDPYCDPVPGFQLLHCLSADGQVGESAFVDGMAAAERLRVHDSDAFTTLCQMPILYRFQDAAVDLVAERTMLDVHPSGEFRAIHYDDRWIAPLPLKGPRLKKYYPAYRRLAELLSEPARTVAYRLLPGDLVLFDNTRILHGHTSVGCLDGQTEVSSRPERSVVEGPAMAFLTASSVDGHLQGCYLDADGLYSSLAVLSRPR